MHRTARRVAAVLTRRVPAVLLLAAMAAAGDGVRGAETLKFSLGALRRDGVMIPFASFDGRVWGVPWPDSDVTVPLPISRDDIPKKWWGPQGPETPWRAALLAGETRPLTLGQPVHAKVFCSGHPAIATDYRGGAIDPREPTVPKDGLAVAGDVKIEPIINVSVHAPEAKRVIALITDEFNKEEKLAAEHFLMWTHPFSLEERAEVPIELEAFYRSIDATSRGAWKTTYVEAIRRFPARPSDNGCGLITFVRGWITEQQGKEPIINLGARVTYCDRAEVSFMLPFGRIVADNEVYWVYQISSWRDEVYTVSRVRATEVRPVVAAAGGGCPRGGGPFGRGRGGA
jgi:hypothetical protein